MNTVRDIIDQGARQHPDRPFLTIAENGVSLSWGELQYLSLQLNDYLNQQQIVPGSKVALMLDNGYWTTVLFLGVMYCGRVVLALNTISGNEALAYVIDHSDSEILFITKQYQDKFSAVLQGLANPIRCVTTDEDAGPEIDFATNEDSVLPSVSAADIALLMYTSGTTGLPKGVLLSHQNVIAGGQNTTDGHQLSADDIAMCVLPLYHINAQMVTVMGPLVSAGQVVMRKRFSVKEFWQDIYHYQCTWFSVVPTIISYLIEQGTHQLNTQKLKAIQARLRFGRSASAALSPAKHQQFEEAFGVPIVETMGLTETAAQILSNPMPPEKNKYGSPGRAVGNDAKVINEDGSDAPTGVIGELIIRGDNVMQGYYKNESATKETFYKNGWLRTGDLSYQDEDGFFFITGRLKELIIKGGENIAPREIDDVLYRHPAVLEAAAFGVDDEHYGQEVMACVALSPGMTATTDELKDFCVDKLGPYKSPKQVFIRDELPKGPSGKIQRLKLTA